MNDYTGPERRNNNDERDHDLLIDIKNKLHNMVQIYTNHTTDDIKKFDDHEERIRFLEKSIWISFGLLAALQVGLKFLKI